MISNMSTPLKLELIFCCFLREVLWFQLRNLSRCLCSSRQSESTRRMAILTGEGGKVGRFKEMLYLLSHFVQTQSLGKCEDISTQLMRIYSQEYYVAVNFIQNLDIYEHCSKPQAFKASPVTHSPHRHKHTKWRDENLSLDEMNERTLKLMQVNTRWT